jgi:lactate dehydrogenase-like 2-hydroxyacid dehydrogenase
MTTPKQEGIKRPQVVVATPLAQDYVDQLQEHCEVTLLKVPVDREALELALKGAEGILLTNRVRVDDALLTRADHLRVISNLGVGLDHIDLDATLRRGIEVTTTPVLTDAVADLVIALVLMLARRLPQALLAVTPDRWRQVPDGHDLAGKMLFIIGFGRIGQEVARRALAFRMRISYFDVRSGLPTIDGADRVADLRSGLEMADFVSLHVDLNNGTHHLIGADELTSMKTTAYLINTSRGGVIDQGALTRALAEGHIAGAGLDVLEEEPPGSDEPLLSEPRAIIVPHIGTATEETRRAMAQLAVDNLLAGVAPKAPHR